MIHHNPESASLSGDEILGHQHLQCGCLPKTLNLITMKFKNGSSLRLCDMKEINCSYHIVIYTLPR